MPIIGDGDTGYGNAVNVKRTVKGYAQAGFAGEYRLKLFYVLSIIFCSLRMEKKCVKGIAPSRLCW